MEEGGTPIEDATPVEDATSVEGTNVNPTEGVAEPKGGDSGEGLMSGQEETSLIGGVEGIAEGKENPSQANEIFAESQTQDKGSTIVQAAEGAGYATFASLARDVGLEDTFNSGGPYTVFAPTDIAFESLPEGMLDDLRSDKKKLNRVLTYHVVSGEYTASALENLDSLISLEDGELAVGTTTGGQVTMESATVVEPDLTASNGVIHGIDKVMLPPGI